VPWRASPSRHVRAWKGDGDFRTGNGSSARHSARLRGGVGAFMGSRLIGCEFRLCLWSIDRSFRARACGGRNNLEPSAAEAWLSESIHGNCADV